jgi:SGNH domain (fused to AT3 domains)
VASALAAATLLVAGIASATRLPSPGTPAEIAALVASSHRITSLPSDLVPSLQRVGDDNAASWGYWKAKDGCTGTTQCVYGDTAATAAVALLGDSHAAMWLPALDWVGRQLHFRLVVLWRPGCPASDVTVLDPTNHEVDTGCDAYRRASLSAIERLAPALVLMADRTTDVLAASGRDVPTGTWRKGLATTIATLLSHGLKVAVIGDVSSLSSPIPACLAAYPRAIQRCSSPNPNPAKHTELAAEVTAAKDEGVPYVNPEPWLCTKVCSPVVGRYAVYSDWQHVSATYSAYLGLEWEGALAPLLPTR